MSKIFTKGLTQFRDALGYNSNTAFRCDLNLDGEGPSMDLVMSIGPRIDGDSFCSMTIQGIDEGQITRMISILDEVRSALKGCACGVKD